MSKRLHCVVVLKDLYETKVNLTVSGPKLGAERTCS